jgi:hypothetical protein
MCLKWGVHGALTSGYTFPRFTNSGSQRPTTSNATVAADVSEADQSNLDVIPSNSRYVMVSI